jgi:hypothetical protein
MTENLKPTDNPTAEAARGRSQFSHAMIYAGIFLILALGVTLLVIKARGKQLVPGNSAPHPTSLLMSIHRAHTTSA